MIVGAVAAGLAALLWTSPPPRLATERGRRRPPGWVLATLLLLPVLGLGPRLLVLSGLAVASGWVGVHLLARRRRRVTAVETGRRVLEACELLAGELAAGSPSTTALRRAAEGWPPLAGAARAAELGGDVAGALREAAARPGAGDLRLVAAAWTVAHRTGHGLGDALSAVASSVRASASTRRIVAGELASARSTARLVAALPGVAWLMGAGSGTQPWEFLLGSGLGLACLAGGLATMAAGLWWIEALAEDPL